MTKLEAIVGATTYDLSDDINYFHIDNDGFGLPPILRLEEQGPLQDGNTDLGFRLEPRIVTLVLAFRTATYNEYFQKRRVIGNIFKPRETPIILQFTDPDENVYQLITHYIQGYSLNSAEKNTFGIYSQKFAVTLKANNPLWYSPNQQIYTYGVGAGSDGFVFPISFPVSFGGSNVDQTQTITYGGDYATSPIIEIHGPITDPVITNLTTGIVLDLTGTTIGAGDYYTIDTRYGNIAVVDNDGTNRIDKLVGDSNLSGFKLIADPDSPNGQNDIQVTGSSANATTIVYIRYYEQYLVV